MICPWCGWHGRRRLPLNDKRCPHCLGGVMKRPVIPTTPGVPDDLDELRRRYAEARSYPDRVNPPKASKGASGGTH